MMARATVLLCALLDVSSAYSLTGVSVMSRSIVMPRAEHARPHGLQRLCMQEKSEEAAPAPTPAPDASVDFTPAPVVEEKKEGGFDPTQYSITISIFSLFCIVKAFSYFGIVDFDD